MIVYYFRTAVYNFEQSWLEVVLVVLSIIATNEAVLANAAAYAQTNSALAIAGAILTVAFFVSPFAPTKKALARANTAHRQCCTSTHPPTTSVKTRSKRWQCTGLGFS